MEKEIKLTQDGDNINVKEVVTYSCDAQELSSKIRLLESERESLIRRSQDLKKRYNEVVEEIGMLKEALKKIDNKIFEEI